MTRPNRAARPRAFRPIAPDDLAPTVRDLVIDRAVRTEVLRVAVDGPAPAAPLDLAARSAELLRAAGHEAVVIAAETFWRDASVRLEYGRHDAFERRNWLDAGALRREVLDPLGPDGDHTYLPSLRDPATNRSTRAPRRSVAPGAVVLVAGDFLLGCGLPFDLSVHLSLTTAARRRRTAAELVWTLPAYDDYDAQVAPADIADLVIRWDDPLHPAVG